MSKRGSLNAIRFAGRSFGPRKVKLKVDSAFKKLNGRLNKKSNKQKQFNEICNLFNFNKENNIELFVKLFLVFKQIKKFRVRENAVKNVKYFKQYAIDKRIPFTIENYINGKYYILEYYNIYPHLFVKTNKNPKRAIAAKANFINSSLANQLKYLLSEKSINNLNKLK